VLARHLAAAKQGLQAALCSHSSWYCKSHHIIFCTDVLCIHLIPNNIVA
jgi:hypothetical protein